MLRAVISYLLPLPLSLVIHKISSVARVLTCDITFFQLGPPIQRTQRRYHVKNRYGKEGSQKVSLSIGSSKGGPGGGLLYRNFERRLTIWKVLPLWSPRDTYKRALETGTSVGWALSGEHGGEVPLLGTFVRKVRFYSSQEPLFHRDRERCEKKALETRISLHRGPVRGAPLPGTFRDR